MGLRDRFGGLVGGTQKPTEADVSGAGGRPDEVVTDNPLGGVIRATDARAEDTSPNFAGDYDNKLIDRNIAGGGGNDAGGELSALRMQYDDAFIAQAVDDADGDSSTPALAMKFEDGFTAGVVDGGSSPGEDSGSTLLRDGLAGNRLRSRQARAVSRQYSRTTSLAIVGTWPWTMRGKRT